MESIAETVANFSFQLSQIHRILCSLRQADASIPALPELQGCTTSCAILSPRRMVNGSLPRLMSKTLTSPR